VAGLGVVVVGEGARVVAEEGATLEEADGVEVVRGVEEEEVVGSEDGGSDFNKIDPFNGFHQLAVPFTYNTISSYSTTTAIAEIHINTPECRKSQCKLVSSDHFKNHWQVVCAWFAVPRP